ncbi:MAG: T9SS type A sorting domain-containing protein [Flavobacteriales bacterium]|nr:T9SS type A sorting domain-containing protein [Flavobacteriales bacterium]
MNFLTYYFRFIFLTFILGLSSLNGTAQQVGTYNVLLEPFTIPNMPGLQSYVWGITPSGYWVLIGGRTDGLHRRQPNSAFLASGNNTIIYMIDSEEGLIWQRPLSELSASLNEQLQSTNMEFYQNGNNLYIIGGYGFSATANDHITHPNLTIVDLSGLEQALINNQPITNYFRQITDQRMAVTGGHLGMFGDEFVLVCGQRFDGRYNPHGPTHGPGFSQQYTNSIRRFSIQDDGTIFSIQNYIATVDTVNLHRRDYNLTPFVHSGQEGYTIWTGVFQYDQDLPYLNTVDVTSSGYQVNNGFNQYLSHYHSAKLPLYDSVNNEMYTIFFGGISQYYYNTSNILVQDDNVPFVKTVSMVKRNALGTMTEYRMPVEMPGYLGASAEFIPANTLPMYINKVAKLHTLNADTVLAGYIVGGINSSAANIFFINDGTQSFAETTIYKVWLARPETHAGGLTEVQDPNKWKFDISPNPALNWVCIQGTEQAVNRDFEISLTDTKGRKIKQLYSGKWNQPLFTDISELPSGLYYVVIRSGQAMQVEKLIKE